MDSASSIIRHGVSVDVEDWPQSTLDHDLPITERVVVNTRRLLQLFAEHQVHATFFILGLVQKQYPFLVREIAAAGHEIASHGYSHKPVYTLGPARFREEVRRSVCELEDLVGCRVQGFRAPDFSINRDCLWAFDILADEGLTYDSSIVPIQMPRYGIPGFPQNIHRLACGLWEIPLSVFSWFGRDWMFAGGGYFRLYPYAVTAWGLRQLQCRQQPAIIYLHPYEIDPHEWQCYPRLPWRLRFTQGLNRSRVEPRLRRIFREFPTTTLQHLVRSPSAAS